MEQPKIGIVTVLYKSANVLKEFFECLDAQTYKNFILYIIDNASPDNSVEPLPAIHSKCLVPNENHRDR